jgi:hypothetical protein
MQAAELKRGVVYFLLKYEDENYARFIVQSNEYLGERTEGESATAVHVFGILGGDDELELKESQLDLMLDVEGLIDALKQA